MQRHPPTTITQPSAGPIPRSLGILGFYGLHGVCGWLEVEIWKTLVHICFFQGYWWVFQCRTCPVKAAKHVFLYVAIIVGVQRVPKRWEP